MVRRLLLLSLVLIALALEVWAAPKAFRVEVVAGNLDFPVTIAFAPDGRLFFNELRTGRVRVIQNGQLLSQPCAEIDVANDGEQGLIGLTFDPDFEDNGFVYVFYTQAEPLRNRVVRFTDRNNRGENVTVIVDNLPAASHHNAGNIAFGPDAKLYVTIGDTTLRDSAQDQNALSGKILRYNADGSVPSDNPFGQNNPVFAMGLRNSFDFAFDPVSHQLFADENGPDVNDEVNVITRGGNYGWPHVTGFTRLAFDNPILIFKRTIAPTGITFLRGNAFPDRFRNDLFFGDFNTGSIHRVGLTSNRRSVKSISVFHQDSEPVIDVASGPDGNLYYTTPSAIKRIVKRKA
jgi:glucose/arabinose dehydrogenase